MRTKPAPILRGYKHGTDQMRIPATVIAGIGQPGFKEVLCLLQISGAVTLL